ncbi:MAG: hypothetical protein ABSH03_10260 [Candidatus Lustribacter sp.]
MQPAATAAPATPAETAPAQATAALERDVIVRAIPIDLNSPAFPDPKTITDFESLLDFGESTAGLVRRVISRAGRPEE